ncbi:MAG TPA: cytochrome P450 [Acidimicrobiales bacterium]
MATTFEFDPFDAKFFDDPYPYYTEMRRDHPVYRREVDDHRVWPHYWMLSRAQDVNAALSDWKNFSSARGTLIDTDTSLLPPNMFNMDPPRHDELRSILSRVLTPSRVAGLEPAVRAFAQGVLDQWKGKGTVDIATDFAQMIPTITMCTLMDLPREERALFLQWNLDTLAGADFTSEASLRAYGEMEDYWTELVVERRARRTNDLISQIIHTQVAGEDLSDAEISGFCSLLHNASQNTTMNMITNSVITLARHPDQRHQLIDNPARWPEALEELLRYESPVQGLARTASNDVTVSDVTIAAGDQVLLLYGSSNHDGAVFERPDVLDFDREVKFHWTFGHGIHYCLGNAVARLETRVAIQVLLGTIPDFEVDETEIVRNQLVPTRGVAHAPISFEPASG